MLLALRPAALHTVQSCVLLLSALPAPHVQARGWEEAAVLSEQQQAALDLVSELCVLRPLPDHVRLLSTLGSYCPGLGSVWLYETVHLYGRS